MRSVDAYPGIRWTGSGSVFAAFSSAGLRARIAWTLGCTLLWVHVALAMHVVHHWDHADLVQTTAQQTAQVTGLRFGGGVYVNYAFMLAWAADVIYWWLVGHARYVRRPIAVTVTLHAFLLFIAFNGTVVFARPVTRWTALACFAALLVIVFTRRLRLWKPTTR